MRSARPKGGLRRGHLVGLWSAFWSNFDRGAFGHFTLLVISLENLDGALCYVWKCGDIPDEFRVRDLKPSGVGVSEFLAVQTRGVQHCRQLTWLFFDTGPVRPGYSDIGSPNQQRTNR